MKIALGLGLVAVSLLGLSAEACHRRDPENDKWLIVAVNDRFLSGVKVALAEGASPNARGALRLAVERHAPDIVTLLLERGASPNTTDENGSTALHSAAWEGDVPLATLLFDKGAEVDPKNTSGETPLMFAAWMDHPALVHLLLSKGAAVNARTAVGKTALMLALREHRNLSLETVKALVEQGADVNVKDDQGYSILWWAVVAEHRLDVVEYLLAHGANPNAHGVLVAAVDNRGRRAILRALLAKGANPNVKDEKGRTALSLAAWRDHESAKMLLASGAGPGEERDREGMLISAARLGATRAVEELLKAHVEVNAMSDRGESALMAAAREGNEDMVRVLLAAGANVNARVPEGSTALMAAIEAGNLSIVQALVAKHADLNGKAPASSRVTWSVPPLRWAEMNNHQDIAAFLKKKGARDEPGH
jgi:ankyrin repeat protein